MEFNVKHFKTCLRYPGGKTRVCNTINQYLPDLNNYIEYREPFVGGASVAIFITKKYPHLNIWINDLYEPLINFYRQLQINGNLLSDNLLECKLKADNPESSRELFMSSKNIINSQESDLNRAIAFYIVNRCSFSGLTEASSFSIQAALGRFTLSGIKNLVHFSKIIEKWKITNYSYEYLMDNNSNAFIYLDPPYDIKSNTLYGKKGSIHREFDHNKFALDCDNNKMDSLISYNSDQLVKDRFLNWNMVEYDLTYSMLSVGEYMKNQKERKELLLFNYNSKIKNKI